MGFGDLLLASLKVGDVRRIDDVTVSCVFSRLGLDVEAKDVTQKIVKDVFRSCVAAC